MNDLKNSIEKRRSNYLLTNKIPISDEQLKSLIDFAVLHVPSAFNSQSARVLLLLNDEHKALWKITEEILSEIVADKDAFEKTKAKINNSFASGYGTILFYEDQAVVESFQKKFPFYSENFPIWSNQASGMHQYALWLLLENEGIAASLQHYNPLIDKKVAEKWGIDPNWKLIAQMPFGIAKEEAGEKTFEAIDSRSILFK